jgi:hypothetical protein
MLNMDPAFLNRNVNEGFSGGEKKRNEILQLAALEVCAQCGVAWPVWPTLGQARLTAARLTKRVLY